MISTDRRSGMVLYSGHVCPFSHRTRLVLAEKNVEVDIVLVDPQHPPRELTEINPYRSVPTFADRDVVLYESRIIAEYLDERYPHPPLMPVDPMARARARLLMFRIERDWYSLIEEIEHGSEKQAAKPRKTLSDSLIASVPLFAQKRYFMSEEFSLVDCSLAPLLWRLPHAGIHLPAQARPIVKYAERLFARHAFQASLTAAERAIGGQ